jgi:hypothetical protein
MKPKDIQCAKCQAPLSFTLTNTSRADCEATVDEDGSLLLSGHEDVIGEEWDVNCPNGHNVPRRQMELILDGITLAERYGLDL